MLNWYEATVDRSLLRPGLVVGVILGVFFLSLLIFPQLGVAFFPRSDAGQFEINLKAPSGTRIEETDQIVAQVEDLSRVQALLDYTKITAPFDGVITQRYADTGAMLAAGITSEQSALPLVKLSQNGLLRLDIPVPEDDVPSVKLQKKVSVEVSALNKTFEGTVARFADKVDPGTRTMLTEVDVPNPTLEIVPGMYAYVDFPVMQRKDALVVPVQAVSHEGTKTLAYRVAENRQIEVVPVSTGMESKGQVQILSGLAQGDRVVIGDTSQLRPGEVVTPKLIRLSPTGESN